MTHERRQSAIRVGLPVLGVILLAGTVHFIDAGAVRATIWRLGRTAPVLLALGGLWHLARTWAWAACFPQPRRVAFLRLARVRLAAEAFSYLTLRGIVGEPLKVVLLSEIDPREATAAVALERIAYLVGTTLFVGLGAILALLTLPLGPVWSDVFRAFAIVAAVVWAATMAVVLGQRTYTGSVFAAIDRALGTSLRQGRVVRFVTAVECHVLELVRGNPVRLAVLMIATAASFLLMALEAWMILRTVGAPATLNVAVAAEAFTRVASFASAFIPANLGTLEASSVAAAVAVGAAGAGAALALARRLRGLFWAGVGLALYPRRLRVRGDRHPSEASIREASTALLYLPHDPSVTVPWSSTLAGLSIGERVVRAAVRAGHSRIIVWAPAELGRSPHARRLRGIAGDLGCRLDVATDPREWRAAVGSLDPSQSVTLVGAGTVVSPSLLAHARSLCASAGRSVDVPAGAAWPESGVIRMAPADAVDSGLAMRELAARRERALPLPCGVDVTRGAATLALRITDRESLAAAEQTIRRATYKETDAKIARFNRQMSLPISIALIRTPLTANQLSVMLVAIGFYAAWLFSAGRYWTGVLAAFLSLAASVLDGSDGEIARLKYQESALGCWIETFGDYSYYLAIFAGLTLGAVRQTHWDGFYWLGAAAMAGTVTSFFILIFLRSRITDGRPEKLHAIAKARFKSEPTFWSRVIWRVSFVATRAAMPYGIMAFALVYALPGIVVLAAVGANVYWISLVLKLRHLLGRPVAAAA